MKRVLLIVNPVAGLRRAESLLPRIIRQFSEAEWPVEVLLTRMRGDATRYVQKYAAGRDLVVCCGGDGTLSETLRGIVSLKDPPPMGYLPAGSTNDFAASLKIPTDPVLAVKKLMSGSERVLDAGLFGDRVFAYTASFGVFTESSYSTPQSLKNTLGRLAYVLEGMKELSTLKPCGVRVEAEGAVYEGEYLFGGFSNSTSIGGVLHLGSEKVDMSDGLLELLLIRNPRSLEELARILQSLSTQEYDESLITFTRVREALVRTQGQTPWSLDGEYERGSGQILVRCLPRAMRIWA